MEEISADKFKEEVRAEGLTMKQICEQAGITEATMSTWMNGKTLPSGDTYNKVVKAVRELGGR